MPPRLKVPASTDPVKCRNCRKAYRKRFCLLQDNPLRDRHLRKQKTPKRHTRNYARTCCLRLNNLSHLTVARTVCHAGQSVRDPSSLLPPSPSGNDTDRAASSLLSPLDQKRQERWKGASFPSISRTPAVRYGAPSITLSAGLDTPPLSKFHRLANREERDTQDREPRVHQDYQQVSIRSVAGPNT